MHGGFFCVNSVIEEASGAIAAMSVLTHHCPSSGHAHDQRRHEEFSALIQKRSQMWIDKKKDQAGSATFRSVAPSARIFAKPVFRNQGYSS
jgi:hypothetical protein